MSEILLPTPDQEARVGDLLVSNRRTCVVVEHAAFDAFCTTVGFFCWKGQWDWVNTRLGAQLYESGRRAFR